jgi:hypothetical protein
MKIWGNDISLRLKSQQHFVAVSFIGGGNQNTRKKTVNLPNGSLEYTFK